MTALRRYVMAFLLLALVVSVAPAANAVIQGHSPVPLVIQGHSPIVLLVIDPLGNEYGCQQSQASSCTSTGSSDFIDQINPLYPAEGPASYDFGTNKITVDNPYSGLWTVWIYYTGTGNPSFTLTATSCPEGRNTCSTTSFGGTATTQGLEYTFNVDTAGIITTGTSVPEFPLGLLMVVGVLALVLLGLNARYLKGRGNSVPSPTAVP